MGTALSQAAATRPCSYCGKPIPSQLNRCPYCREEVPEVRLATRAGKDGGRQIQRGLVYMLLGAVIYYFAGGYSPFPLPIPMNPDLVLRLAQLVFLGGMGLCAYGFYLRIRS